MGWVWAHLAPGQRDIQTDTWAICVPGYLPVCEVQWCIQLAKGMAKKHCRTHWNPWASGRNHQWHQHNQQQSSTCTNKPKCGWRRAMQTAVLTPNECLVGFSFYKWQYFNSRVYIWGVSVPTLSLMIPVCFHFITNPPSTALNTLSFLEKVNKYTYSRYCQNKLILLLQIAWQGGKTTCRKQVHSHEVIRYKPSKCLSLNSSSCISSVVSKDVLSLLILLL